MELLLKIGYMDLGLIALYLWARSNNIATEQALLINTIKFF